MCGPKLLAYSLSMHIFIYVCICVWRCLYGDVFIHMHVFIYMYVGKSTCVYAYVPEYVCMSMYVWVCISMYVVLEKTCMCVHTCEYLQQEYVARHSQTVMATLYASFSSLFSSQCLMLFCFFRCPSGCPQNADNHHRM